ncbi:MAG: CCDC90 family protein [Thiomonas sp.]
MIDTLFVSTRLKQSGMPPEQADAVALVIDEALAAAAATKQDLDVVSANPRKEIRSCAATLREESAPVKTDLQKALAQFEIDLQKEISQIRTEMQKEKTSLIKWMVGLAFGQTAIILSVLALMRFGK